MRAQPGTPGPPDDGPTPRRFFLREPGWKVGHKVGSTREFCYMMAPGQDYYHRLGDGELFVYSSDERLCLACAERRGLLDYDPKVLREAKGPVEIQAVEGRSEFEVRAVGGRD